MKYAAGMKISIPAIAKATYPLIPKLIVSSSPHAPVASKAAIAAGLASRRFLPHELHFSLLIAMIFESFVIATFLHAGQISLLIELTHNVLVKGRALARPSERFEPVVSRFRARRNG